MQALSAVHAATLSDNCLTRNDWVCPEYVRTRVPDLTDALVEHVQITLLALLIGVVLAVPLAILAHRFKLARPLTLGASTALYTVPSLAMFSLLLPVTGLSKATVITGLVLYSLTILVRNILAGLDGVDPEVLDAARGMGFSRARTLWKVELPLALPASFAGLRVAAVSTVALTTVGTIVGFGGFGDLLTRGLRANFNAEVATAAVACVLLAALADVLLIPVQRVLTPWTRGRTS